MDKRHLRQRHIKVIAKREIINLLDRLHIKDFLRRSQESNMPAFKENLDIEERNKNIIVFPNIPWNYRKQRPQQIFSRLAKKGYNIFYISPITTDKEYLSRLDSNIYEVHVRTKTNGNVLRDFHLDIENENVFVESLTNLLGKYFSKKTFVFVLHPVWKNVAFRIPDVKRVYDLMDLYSGFKESKSDLVDAEHVLISDSDVVLTTARNLFDYAKGLNKNVHMVKNGCDFEHFDRLKKNGVLDALSDRPIVGYYGAITYWLDTEVLEGVVKNNQDKYFVFIGAVNTNNVRRLYRYRNVYFLGEVDYGELPGYLAYFSVCMIPFVLNDLILSTDPVKFYEYISSGKPVISARFPELKEYSDICYLYDSVDDFNMYLDEALKEVKDLKKKRIEVAKRNSWDSRVNEIIKILNPN